MPLLQVGNMEDGTQRKYYSAYVDDPAAAAKDADRCGSRELSHV